MERQAYPSDVSDDEWSFVAPYLTLMTQDVLQREHDLREVFNGLRWIVRTGAQWRIMPHDLPPWAAVYQQAQRWLKAGCFEAIVDDLRAVLRLEVIKLPQAKRGFVLLPRRWAVERSFAWMTRFRRLASDYERLPETLAGLHSLAFAVLMLHRFALVMAHCP